MVRMDQPGAKDFSLFFLGILSAPTARFGGWAEAREAVLKRHGLLRPLGSLTQPCQLTLRSSEAFIKHCSSHILQASPGTENHTPSSRLFSLHLSCLFFKNNPPSPCFFYKSIVTTRFLTFEHLLSNTLVSVSYIQYLTSALADPQYSLLKITLPASVMSA